MDYMLWGYESGLTILIAIVGIIIVSVAQWKLRSTYNLTRKIKCNKKLSGCEVARMILDQNGLDQVHVVETKGELTDHYDPSRKVIRLSHEIFHGDSIASISVAAHEVGHAIQHKEGYFWMNIRSALVPVVNFVTYAGYVVSIISLFFGSIGYLKVAIFMLGASLVFQLVTLPVEFDASKRANVQLFQLGIVDASEQTSVRNMLTAAAMTYVASLVNSILNILRLVIMLQDRDSN